MEVSLSRPCFCLSLSLSLRNQCAFPLRPGGLPSLGGPSAGRAPSSLFPKQRVPQAVRGHGDDDDGSPTAAATALGPLIPCQPSGTSCAPEPGALGRSLHPVSRGPHLWSRATVEWTA